ncbi:alpha/beta hydrolase [Pelomyxa schiedti]|nr:alpha/beta hydrolase [Pelomyxa schiedti]
MAARAPETSLGYTKIQREISCLCVNEWREVAYVDWVPATTGDSGIVLCVHGLTRTSYDFEPLAKFLVLECNLRVVCVDLVGRGRSDWLSDPANYNLIIYASTVATLMSSLGIGVPGGYKDCLFVGTSLGGLIGMVLASAKHAPIRRLFMNDIGPYCPKESLEFLRAIVTPPKFNTLEDAVNFHRQVACVSWGPISDEHLLDMIKNTMKCDPTTGAYTFAYDPEITASYKGPIVDLNLWSFFEQIKCPVFVLHGGKSPLLSQQTLDEMHTRALSSGVNLQSHTVPYAGHVPALIDVEEIRIVSNFLTH